MNARAVRIGFAGALVASAAGCDLYFGDRAGHDDAASAPTPTRGVDVLFVIANYDMPVRTAVLHRAYTPFVAALDALPGGRPDLHVGFVSTTVDLGFSGLPLMCPSPDPDDNGLLQDTPAGSSCTPPSDRYIVDVADGSARATNYAGALDAEMRCISIAGDAGGCPFEAPLEAMKRALDGTQPQNAGFLRDGAVLAVVFVTKQDDCSATPALFALLGSDAPPDTLPCAEYGYTCDQPISPTAPGTYTDCVPATDAYLSTPSSYASFLTALKGSSRLVVAAIAGDPTPTVQTDQPCAGCALEVSPSCTPPAVTGMTPAQPADRLVAFMQPLSSQFASTCDATDDAALANVASAIGEALASGR